MDEKDWYQSYLLTQLNCRAKEHARDKPLYRGEERVLTVQMQPPEGQEGIPEGTAYVAVSSYGVLNTTRLYPKMGEKRPRRAHLYATEKTTRFSGVTLVMSDYKMCMIIVNKRGNKKRGRTSYDIAKAVPAAMD